MIPPRERGRYNGYLGAVLALATVGGPLLGGVIVDTSWLGWRWCFFIGVPIAAIAFGVLQLTLRLRTVRRTDVQIDYLGAGLIAVGVSALLIWMSFVDNSFGWVSWQTLAFVLPSLLILAAAVRVEMRAAQPVVPLDIIRQRTPALAILASLAVGMAMFGGAVFLGQYFQIGRGYSPTEAGLLTIPLMFGVLVSSTVTGRLITRTGKIKPYIVAGAVVLVVGFLGLGTIDHETPLLFVSAGMLLVGVGVGMTMQNLVLAVQNAVSLRDLGAASGSVTFFRSLGGTIGVSVLGAVLANRVTATITENLAQAGVPAPGGGRSTLNVTELSPAAQTIVRAAYGDATGHIFLASAGIAVVGVIAALLLKSVILRSSLDLPARAATEPGTIIELSGAVEVDSDATTPTSPTRADARRSG